MSSQFPVSNYLFSVDPNDSSDILYIDPNNLKGVDKFVELVDGPNDYGVLGQYLMSNGGGLEWVNGTGGLTKFTQLSDCPNNYGSALQSLITDGSSNITYGPVVPQTVQELNDVNNFSGVDQNKLVVLDPTGSFYTYDYLPIKVKDEVRFSDLLDVPANYTLADANKAVVVNSNGTALVYSPLTIPSTFTGLIDCPNSYVGANNYKVKVNNTATGLEFVEDIAGGGVDKFIDLNDVLLTYSQNTYKHPQVNYLQNALTMSPNGQTELTTANLTTISPSLKHSLWYNRIFINRPKLFFSYSYNANTISPNNNRGYNGSLLVNITDTGNYNPHNILGLNNAKCFGNSIYRSIIRAPTASNIWNFNENSGILTFGNPTVSNGLESHPLLPVGTLINFKCTIDISAQHDQTPNKDSMIIYGLGHGTNPLGNPSQLNQSTSAVINGSQNNAKPTAGMQATTSKTFIISISPNTAQYFNVDLSVSALNNDGNLVGGIDIVNYSWTLEEL